MKHVRFVFSSACVSPPPSAALHRDPLWSPGLRSEKTLWPRRMRLPWKSQHSKVAEKPFVLLNGCEEWQSTRGRLAWRMFDHGLIYSPSFPFCFFFLLFFFFKWRQIARNKVVVYSFPRVWLSLPPNAAILDKFMKKQMAATGALPAVLEVCAPFGWKTRRSVCETQPVRLCLSIILLSSSSSKKRAIAFVLRLCICFHVIFTVAEKDVLRTVLRRKIAAWYEAFVNCQLMLKKKKNTSVSCAVQPVMRYGKFSISHRGGGCRPWSEYTSTVWS